MDPNNKMKFGVFMAPFHRVGENPHVGPGQRP